MCYLVYYEIAEDTSKPTVTRSKIFTKTLIDPIYKEENELKCGSKLPDGRLMIGRMMYLCKVIMKGQKTVIDRRWE